MSAPKPVIKGKCRYCHQPAWSIFGDIYMIVDNKSAYRWMHTVCLRRRFTWLLEGQGFQVNAERTGPLLSIYVYARGAVHCPVTINFTACCEAKTSRPHVRVYKGPWQVSILGPRSARNNMRTSSFYTAHRWARGIGVQHVQAWQRYAQDEETELRRRIIEETRAELNVQIATQAEAEAVTTAATERQFRGIKLRSK